MLIEESAQLPFADVYWRGHGSDAGCTSERPADLAGEQSLRDLVGWLAEMGWELRNDAPEAAALDAIRTIELHIGIFTSGRCTRDGSRNACVNP